MSFRYVLLVVLLLVGVSAQAVERYEASSLKYLYEIDLSFKKDQVRGVFMRSEYGVNRVKYRFTGTVKQVSEQARVLYITFSDRDVVKNGEPYTLAKGKGPITWRMVKTAKGPRIYVEMITQVKPQTPRWKPVELEFEPED